MLRRNYDKAENLLKEALVKFRTRRIFKDLEEFEQMQQQTVTKVGTVSLWFTKMKSDFMVIQRKNPKLLKTMGITMTQLNQYEKNAQSITAEEWRKLKEISRNLVLARGGLYDADTAEKDREIIEREIDDYRDRKPVTARRGWKPA